MGCLGRWGWGWGGGRVLGFDGLVLSVCCYFLALDFLVGLFLRWCFGCLLYTPLFYEKGEFLFWDWVFGREVAFDFFWAMGIMYM